MATENWTSQLHIIDGIASEDAPEIAYAQRADHRGRAASLYILAEPDRPGSEPFIGELVSQIGEEFLEGEGSLTGILQRVIRDRHADLLEWNRTSLPRDQASYGISCLLVRENDIFLMQLGPCLAYYRHDGRLLRRRPSTDASMEPLGGSESSAPQFSQLELSGDDWVLLISSAVTTTIGEEAIGALRASPAEDVLPALYPKLRVLPRVSALVVAPGGAAAAPVQRQETAIVEESPLGVVDPAPAAPPPAAAPTFTDAAPPPLPSGPAEAAGNEPDRTPGADSPAGRESWPADDRGEEFEHFPERRSLGEAIGGFFATLGGLVRRRPPADDPWLNEEEEDVGPGASVGGPSGANAPGESPSAGNWASSPLSDPEIGAEPTDTAPAPEGLAAAEGRAGVEITIEHDAEIDPIDETPIEAVVPITGQPERVADEDPEPPAQAGAAREPEASDPSAVEFETGDAGLRTDDTRAGDTRADERGAAEPLDATGESAPANDPAGEGANPDPGDDEADNPWGSSPGGSGGAGTPGPGGSVEYHMANDRGGGPGVLEPQATGWPRNPFTTPAPPVLETGQDADQARFPRPLFALEGHMLSFRGRRPRDPGSESEAAPIVTRRGWGALALAVVAVLGILAVVVGVLLIPDLLENSEQNQFEDLLADARRDLTAASLTSDAVAGRSELTSAQVAVQEALGLRPLDESALALEQEVTTALSQINAVVRPPDLVEVLDLSGRVPPPLALSLVQVGGDALYLLDESGGRVFALPLSGGEPEVIFEAGTSYPLLFLFDGPQAGAPVSMQWSSGAAGASLTILDANARLFRFLPGEGVSALEMPNRELIGSPDAVAVDETGIFVLDVSGGSIWRFPQLSDATLLEPQPAIARTDLSTAGSLAVGESLFVAGADGRIRRFSDGADQGFPLLDLDRPLLVPDSLAIGGLTGLIYAVDRGNNRVTVFTPAGELVAQLRADELNGVRGVVPDEANGRLYFVTADVLLASTLPPIIDR